MILRRPPFGITSEFLLNDCQSLVLLCIRIHGFASFAHNCLDSCTMCLFLLVIFSLPASQLRRPQGCRPGPGKCLGNALKCHDFWAIFFCTLHQNQYPAKPFPLLLLQIPGGLQHFLLVILSPLGLGVSCFPRQCVTTYSFT